MIELSEVFSVDQNGCLLMPLAVCTSFTFSEQPELYLSALQTELLPGRLSDLIKNLRYHTCLDFHPSRKNESTGPTDVLDSEKNFTLLDESCHHPQFP